ncbi:MAG: hypothetical protein AAGD96_36635, partial [Chloroflexota bacterium]
MDRYTILISQLTWSDALEPYRMRLKNGATPGRLLKNRLEENSDALENSIAFLRALMNTKKPQIFAESALVGDGSDWNMTELGILGDVSVATSVTIFDDGRHRQPDVHDTPFKGTLLFTPGALLRNGH